MSGQKHNLSCGFKLEPIKLTTYVLLEKCWENIVDVVLTKKKEKRKKKECSVSKQIWTTSSKMPLFTRTNETVKWTNKIVNVF